MDNRTIPLIDPVLADSYAEAVAEQIRSGFLGPGGRTSELAEALASFTKVSHCSLTVSGTVALGVAAHGVGLAPGDEILVPAYGVVATANAFASIGLKLRLVDIDRHTGCMDPVELKHAITTSTKAVCFVNFSGYTGENLVEIAGLCRNHGLPLIEDSACALGQTFQGRHAGTFGDAGIFSFSVPKIITTGQGGAVVTDDEEIHNRVAAYIDHGDLEWRKTNLNRAVGTNMRFNDIQARLGLCQLADIEERLVRKRRAFKVLKNGLGDRLFDVPEEQAPLQNIVFSQNPDALVKSLRSQGIHAVRQYRTVSEHPAYRHLAATPFPNADYWTHAAVYLPFGSGLTAEDALRIVNAVNAVEINNQAA